jgi:amino acid adenylation domain-containing protein
MGALSKVDRAMPPEQQAIRARCFHPSGTFVEFPKGDVERSIPERFEKVVRMYSDRLAVKTGDRLLTYGEFNAMANRIAHAILDERGEGNRPVAILMEHGAEVLAAILGALKAGRIYVPLEPTYPVERLRYMLADSQAELILAHNRTLQLAHQLVGTTIQLANTDEIKNDIAVSNVNLSLSPDTLAYIIYTSGSTGRPKGVVDNHRNVLHGTLRFTNGLHICPDDRLSFTHSCSTSASVRRIFPALLNGASLFPFDVRREGMSGLFDWITNEKITIFSTGRIRDFVRNLGSEHKLSGVRLLSLGGEVVHRTDVDCYRRVIHPECLIGIWMSCTETGNVTQFLIATDSRIDGDIAPIGYAAEDTEVLLLDAQGNLIAAGEVGEIVVKSEYLAVGYWNRPDLTNERFRPDPDGGTKRLYRTGDLGRRDRDGCLFHLGRKDDQVKVRGHRVEVVEVEAALMSLGYFRKTFVTLRDRSPGEKSLVAYLVPQTRPVPTTSTLRTALAATLPNHMIPTVFVMLDSLPLTPTGKVDRNALPDPGNSRPELDTPFVKPRTAVESELSKVWCEVLGLAQVGVDDNFFDLGGHSLAAARVISRVIEIFQLELALKALFDSPTVAEMAKIIALNQAKTASHEDLDRMLKEVEAMSKERAQELLNEEITQSEKPAERE